MKVLLCCARWLPALGILAASWYLSSQPTIEHLPQFWNADKLVHLVCFAGFAFWIAFAIGQRPKVRWRILLPIIFIAVYGIIDEIHQSYTPGRECSFFDWLADTVGAALGSVVFFYVYRLFAAWRHRRRAVAER